MSAEAMLESLASSQKSLVVLVLLANVWMQGVGSTVLQYNRTNVHFPVEDTTKPFHCEGGWILFMDNCYRAFAERLYFLDAEDRCVEEGAQLTSISSTDENIFVSTLLGNTAGWLGGTFVSPDWVWVDDTAWNRDSANWNSDAVPEEGDCVKMNGDTRTWIIAKPDDSVDKYLCKKAASTEASTTTTDDPTEAPTYEPTEAPTDEPTEAPTDEPTEAPTYEPTEAPTDEPTEAPTYEPTEASTDEPTEAPTDDPTEAPTYEPTEASTYDPTEAPTEEPTEAPTYDPTEATTSEPYPACDPDWLEHDGKCYKLFEETVDFDSAEAMCNLEAGHLTSISSEVENTYISSLLGGVEGWLGGKYDESFGWLWLDWTYWGTTFWEGGIEPIPSNGDTVIKMNGGVTWTTANPTETLDNFVCEKDIMFD